MSWNRSIFDRQRIHHSMAIHYLNLEGGNPFFIIGQHIITNLTDFTIDYEVSLVHAHKHVIVIQIGVNLLQSVQSKILSGLFPTEKLTDPSGQVTWYVYFDSFLQFMYLFIQFIL